MNYGVIPTNKGGGSGGNTVASAWANYDGKNNVIRDSYNISSITDNGTGDYTFNFTVSMSNSNYCVTGSGQKDLVGTETIFAGILPKNGGLTTDSVRIGGRDYNSTQDLNQVHITIFSN